MSVEYEPGAQAWPGDTGPGWGTRGLVACISQADRELWYQLVGDSPAGLVVTCGNSVVTLEPGTALGLSAGYGADPGPAGHRVGRTLWSGLGRAPRVQPGARTLRLWQTPNALAGQAG